MLTDIEKGISAFYAESYNNAYDIFFSLAECGNAQAQCYIGLMYHMGYGVLADGELAAYWYLKCTKNKNASKDIKAVAYNNLSCMYFTGAPGFPSNKELATKFKLKSCELGFIM